MATRFMSLATAVIVLDIYLRSQFYSSDPLFFFVSNSLAVNVAMILLAGSAAVVSFKNRFKKWLSYAATSAMAVLLSIFGFFGVAFDQIGYPLSNYLFTLNYLVIMQCGIILGLCALSYEHAKRPENIKLASLAPLLTKLKLAVPVPKIPHSPTPMRPNRAM
jgi:hypothetical protein